MATVNLGRIKPVWQGTWDNSTQYIADDIVYYNNSAWVAVATNTNSAPADANANWDKMAQGADIPTGATSGQVLTAGASDTYTWETLPPSDDASALTQGTLPADVMPSGSVLQTVYASYDNVESVNVTSYTAISLNASITPKSATSKFLLTASLMAGVNGHDSSMDFNFSDSLVGTNTPVLNKSVQGSTGQQMFQGWGSYAGASTIDDWLFANINPMGLYTPGYQNTNTRTFYVIAGIRSSNTSHNIIMNRTQNSGTDNRAGRGVSTLIIQEIAA